MKEKKQKERKFQNILMVAIYVAILTIVVLLFQNFLYAPMRVIGNSMNPAFHNNDILIVNRYVYKNRNPERFEVIVFDYKYDFSTQYVKRVIGLPGETIEIKNNKIYINSEELKEYYGIYKGGEKVLEDYEAYTLGKDEFFVLGDNRDESVDSRSGDVAAVSRDIILGKAVFRLFPWNAIGSLKYQ